MFELLKFGCITWRSQESAVFLPWKIKTTEHMWISYLAAGNNHFS